MVEILKEYSERHEYTHNHKSHIMMNVIILGDN